MKLRGNNRSWVVSKATGAIVLLAVALVIGLSAWNFDLIASDEQSLDSASLNSPDSVPQEQGSELDGDNRVQDFASEVQNDGRQKLQNGIDDATAYLEIDQRFVNPPCPIPLPESAKNISYSKTTTIETWKHTTSWLCADYAQAFLQQLQPTGAELLQAGYLDLTGQSWGCTVRSANNESISVTMLPKTVFLKRSNTNPLEVTVIKILDPELS